MTYEIRHNDKGLPWILFIPTESGEMSLHPVGDPRRPDSCDAVLSELAMSRARDIVGPILLTHRSLGFPGVAAPEGKIYRIDFDQGCALMGFNK